MRVLLVGSYAPDGLTSMQRFADVMHQGLTARGIDVFILSPQTVAARGLMGGRGLGKWLGYVDKFLLFPPRLRRAIARRTRDPLVVHLCDQGNALYTRWITDVPHVVTCHDLLAVRAARGEFAETRTRWPGRLLQGAILRGLRRAGCIVCDSGATHGDLVRLVGPQSKLVGVIPPGVSPAFGTVDRNAALARVSRLLPTAQPARYVLHVGGNQWYKNRRGLVAIYGALVESMPEAPPLVMVGAPLPPSLVRTIADRGLSGRVVGLTGLADADLAALYSCASLLLFPSLAEGYGWPVLEAMACGCRVVASNLAPINEIGGRDVAYVEPGDPTGSAKVVAGVLTESEATRSAHVADARARAGALSSDAMVDAYVRTYRGVLARRADPALVTLPG